MLLLLECYYYVLANYFGFLGIKRLGRC